jgi:hypothetical protein
VSGLRTLDHDHTHVALLKICFLLSLAEKYRPVGVRLLSVRVTGGHRTLSDRASGSGLLLVLGLFLPAGSLLKRTLDVEPGFPGRLGEKPWWNVS